MRCSRCGTPLAVRVDLRNELSADYEQGGYVLHKEMMDRQCFAPMRARVRFDSQHNVIEQSVEGRQSSRGGSQNAIEFKYAHDDWRVGRR